MFQVNTGIRNIVMPGARRVMIVVMKLTAPRMVPKPASASPMIHISAPMPGERTIELSGAYAVHPKAGPPNGVRKLPSTIRPPKRKSQYENMFSRGKATSGEPI